jgi:molybdenum cofactor cytidylyltransferase
VDIHGHVVALILAAGFSSRMGAFKPLLSMDGSLLIERTIARFLQAGFADVRVVVGYRADEVIPTLNRLGARPIVNEDYPTGMYSSLRAGVRTFGKDDDAFFLLPGDSPFIRPETLAEMVRIFLREKAGILHPTCRGRRGHPPLISTRYKELILAGEPPGGLKTLLADHAEDAIDVETDDEGILIDLDTPRDFRMALERCAAEAVPTEARCLFLLNRHGVPERAIAHSQRVTALARKIAVLLMRKGVRLDLNLITASGLLHGLANGKPRYAEAEMRMITAWGYPKVAAIVGSHPDMVPAEDTPPGEGEILRLANKLVEGARVRNLFARRHQQSRWSRPALRMLFNGAWVRRVAGGRHNYP